MDGGAEEGPIEETYYSFVEMILSRMTDTYAEVRKAAPNEISDTIVKFGHRSIRLDSATVGLLLHPKKVSRETDEVDVPIQWVFPSYLDTVVSDRGDQCLVTLMS